MILATKSGAMIRELPIRHVQFHETLMSGSEFSFTVYKNECVGADGEIDETFWDGISDFRLGYCPEVELWYELTMDVTESSETSKAVQAISLGEAELGQINVYGIEVNTESDIARDDYVPTVLYNASNPDASLINRLLYKAPHYRVEHVDASIAGMQRTFQFDGKSVYDAFQEVATEIDCLFKIECRKTENDVIDRAISVYDLENTCQNCGNRGEFLTVCDKCGSTTIRKGYGEDTSIYIARENLAQEVNYSTNTDEVKNCFRLEGGDDLMTSTIINCNPNGSQYIWYLTDAMKADMSAALRNRLNSYDALYDRYQNTETYSPPSWLRTSYNNIVTKYRTYKPELEQIPATITGFPALMTAYYNTIDLQLFLESVLMPSVDISSTTAAEQAARLTQIALSPCAVANLSACTNTTAGNAVLGMAKCLVRGSYQVKVNGSSYNSSTHIWNGNFTVTNYSDETDTANSSYINVTINEDTETYINQKLTALLYRESDDATDISALFQLEGSEFSNELKKYCLNRLSAFRDACQAAMDILIQQGVADQASWAGESTDLYTDMYIPYRNKMAAIESEIALRESEIATVVGKYDAKGGLLSYGMQSILVNRRNTVQNALNFESYLGTTLWKEFASYRRESTFENQNYISDGLNNEELFARAELFLNVARVEIYKSAMLQHTISATMNDLLSMQEFQPLRNKFAVGNWIRVRADGDVYRLRLSEYTVDYDSWGIDVVFTDVREGYDSASDIQSLLGAVRSMQTTYGNVARQASNGNDTMEIMNRWADVGFELTTKIVGNAQNQEFVMDESGLTGRELVPETGEYQKGQIKIISSGVYVTNDGWLTAKAGLGKFRFWDPQDRQEKDGFGVIADQLVGNMVLAGAVGVFNKSGSVRLDERGFTLTTSGSSNTSVFTIRKHSGSSYSNILSLDSTGNLVLGGGNIKGSISAALLTIGTIRDQANTNYWNLETGEFRLSATTAVGTGSSTIGTTVVATDVQYGNSSSSSTAPTTWTTNANWQQGKYLWTRMKMTAIDGTISYSAARMIAGTEGLGVASVVEQYYLSTSSTTKPSETASGWSDTQPTWVKGRYYWTRSKITWSNGTTTYTTATLATALTSGNQSTNTLDDSLNQEGVFNRLTNNGALQGIYMSDGQLYINATYIQTGTLSATRIKGGTLTLGGTSNGNGLLQIKDKNGQVIVQGNNTGLTVTKGSITGSSIIVGGSANGNGTISVKNASDKEIVLIDNTGIKVKNTSGTTIVTANANGLTVTKGTISGTSISGGTITGTTVIGSTIRFTGRNSSEYGEFKYLGGNDGFSRYGFETSGNTGGLYFKTANGFLVETCRYVVSLRSYRNSSDYSDSTRAGQINISYGSIEIKFNQACLPGIESGIGYGIVLSGNGIRLYKYWGGGLTTQLASWS